MRWWSVLLVASLLGLGGAASAAPVSPELRVIVIGLNEVDDGAYAGLYNKYVPALAGAENDARDMAALLGAGAPLLGRDATRPNVERAIKNAWSLEPGDMLIVFYSGHGGRIPDPAYKSGFNSTWCLYDGQLPGRQLGSWWTGFKKGVRIVVVSDSCHSGTVIRLAGWAGEKQIPDEVQKEVNNLHRSDYTRLQKGLPTPEQNAADTHAAVLLLAACGDEETTKDGKPNGEFTDALMKQRSSAAFPSDYDALRTAIERALHDRGRQQTPALFPVGEEVYALRRLRPFKP